MNNNFKKIDISEVLFFDIETVRKNKELDPNSREFELYQKKIRNRETDELPSTEETLLDYEKRGALKLGFNTVITIGVGFVKENKVYVKSIVGTEEEVIKEFFNITQTFKFISGYNILGFDLPICNYNGSKYFDVTEHINNSFNVSGAKPWTVPNIVDLMDIVKGTFYGIPSFEEVLYHYDLPSSKDDISGADVSRVYYDEGIDRIEDYVKKDVFASIQLFQKLQGKEISSEFTDRNSTTERVKLNPLQRLHRTDYFSDSIKDELRVIFEKKRPTKKDKEHLQEIIESVYKITTFMASDTKDVMESKKQEVEEFLKTIK